MGFPPGQVMSRQVILRAVCVFRFPTGGPNFLKLLLAIKEILVHRSLFECAEDNFLFCFVLLCFVFASSLVELSKLYFWN